MFHRAFLALLLFYITFNCVYQPCNMPEAPIFFSQPTLVMDCHCFVKSSIYLFLCSKQLAHLQMDGSSWNHQKQRWIRENLKMQSVMGQRYLITKKLMIYSMWVSNCIYLPQQSVPVICPWVELCIMVYFSDVSRLLQSW